MQIPEIPIDRFEVFATGIDHAECVAFDRDAALWCGGEAGQVYRIDGSGKHQTVANLGGFCAGLAFSPSDELFVCNSALGVVHVSRSGKFEVFADRVSSSPITCANFAVFDGAGNLYLSDSGKWMQHNGNLLRFSPDGKGEILAGPFGYPNGLALSADGRQLFMIESETNSIQRFSLREDGSLSAAEQYATEVGRFPDGLALDAAGNLYASCYASDEIHRIAPDQAHTLFAYDPWGIKLGAPTNMAFGGPGFEYMYVANLGRTTITRAHVDRRGQPLANQRK